MEELIEKQQEIITLLTDLNKTTLNLLSQYINIEQYENELNNILKERG